MGNNLQKKWKYWNRIIGRIHGIMCTSLPGGHSSGGRALTAKFRGPRFNPGWLLVFHSSLKIFPSLSSCMYWYALV